MKISTKLLIAAGLLLSSVMLYVVQVPMDEWSLWVVLATVVGELLAIGHFAMVALQPLPEAEQIHTEDVMPRVIVDGIEYVPASGAAIRSV